MPRGSAAEGMALTKVGNGNDVKHAPDILRLLALHHAVDLPACPRVGAIAADDVFGLDRLGLGAGGLGGLQERRVGVGRQVAPVEAVRDLVSIAIGGGGLLDGLGQLADRDGDGVGIVGLGLGGVDGEGLGHQATLDGYVAVLLDVLEDVGLDATWWGVSSESCP